MYLCKEKFCHFNVSVFGRQMEGREAFLRCCRHRGAMLQQDRGHLAEKIINNWRPQSGENNTLVEAA